VSDRRLVTADDLPEPAAFSTFHLFLKLHHRRRQAMTANAIVQARIDAWFRTKVREALDDPHPALAQDAVEKHFARRRAAALLKAIKGDLPS
jgi:hypothetical protein